MRALKVLVVVMGVLLVVGTIGLVLAVMNRANHPVAATPAPVVTAGTNSTIDLPAGAKVIGTELSGDRVLIRLSLADGGEQLLTVNTATGARVGTITLRPAKP